ncbi:methyl-accepting chemotaxis protein [Imhoffiella purpurea]|uniref:Methyl-accepting chemotaxis protein n=1 Tax=Imhoffiella purpurea TaxID=1249627 RepID=W9VDA6_9GAMM|nr:methyl-accepting chemotaxis protein [Imhoffiella purpurea]EXJ14966.1 hypothetical protein D779_1930 [Imhoffiella purpurea]
MQMNILRKGSPPASLSLRVKLLSLVVFFVILTAVTGSTGLYHVAAINDSVVLVTETSSPLVQEASGLIRAMDQIYIGLLEILAKTAAATPEEMDARLEEFETQANQAVERMQRLSEHEQDLGPLISDLTANQREFLEKAHEMLRSQRVQNEKREVVDARVAEFESVRESLAVTLVAMARRGEATMSELEDRSKTLTQSGEATVEDIQGILSGALNRTYPVIRGAYAMQSYVLEAEDLTRTYAGETEAETLDNLEAQFRKAIKKAKTRLRKMSSHLETGVERADHNTVATDLDRLSEVAEGSKSAEGGEGLFLARRQLLEATAQAESWRASLEQTGRSYEKALAAIADHASKLNSRSQNRLANASGQAIWSIGGVVAAGSLIGLILGYLLVTSLLKPIRKASVLTEAMSEGDFRIETGSLPGDEVGRMLLALDGMSRRLSHTLHGVSDSANDLSGLAETTLAITEKTREEAERQLAVMEQASTAITELSASVDQVATSTSMASEAARQADLDVREGGQVVDETVRSIEALAEEVHKADEVVQELAGQAGNITAVLDVIRHIAQQTNLLALNASIESARAGEHGRGFAVVANEVRTLATRTHASTEEIQQIIEQFQAGTARAAKVMQAGRAKVGLSVEQATKAGRSLEKVKTSAAVITQMSGQIASAVEEQSSVANDIDRSIVGIAETMRETARDALAVAEANARVTARSTQLQRMMGQFRLRDSGAS